MVESTRSAPSLARILGLAGLLSLAGCGGQFTIDEPLEDRVELPPDLRRLRIQVPLGAVTVTASEADALVLEALVRRWASDAEGFAVVQAIEVAPRLEPVADAPGTYLYRLAEVPESVDERTAAVILKSTLEVPAGIAVDVDTGRGEVAVTGRRADVTVATGSGRVLIDGIHGAAAVSTGNGEVVIHDHHGSLEASTGYETIVAYVEEFGEAGVRLRTEGPSMIVHLPPEQGFDLDARVDRSTVGKVGVRQSFDLPVEEVGRGHRAIGSVRGGGPPVRLEVGRGYLSVVDRRPNEDR